jgi:predicted dehydrogenase
MSVRIGVIGGGKFGALHLRTFRQMGWDGEVELAAVCRVNESALAAQAAEFGIKGYTDYRRMLDDQKLDAVTIVTPDHLHREMALEAIARGLNVLVEKPLDTTSAGCREIVEAADAAGVLLQVDFHKRYDPEHRAVERAIRQGRMGSVLYGYAWMEDRIEVPVDWFPHWAAASSPAWFLGVHFYDLVRWMIKSDPVEVYAVGRKEKLAKELGIDAYDSVSAHVTFENGAQFAFQTSWILPRGFEAVVNQGVRLIGTEGIWEVDSQSRGSQSCLNDAGMQTWNSNANREYEDAEGRIRLGGYVIESIEDFARNVARLKSGTSLTDVAGHYPSGRDGLQATRIAEAVHRSIGTGEIVRLNPL